MLSHSFHADDPLYSAASRQAADSVTGAWRHILWRLLP